MANYADYKEAVRAVGLEPNQLDHGTIGRARSGQGFGIWVYELGLRQPKVDKYFALGRQLFNGSAVIYAFDAEGETSNVTKPFAEHLQSHHISWYDSIEVIEHAIGLGLIDRPQSAINGEVFWEWNR
jgi:hypothetical protein